MFSINNLNITIKYFLTISGELILLFVGVTFLVSLLQEYIPPEKIQSVLTRQKKLTGNIIGAALGAVTPFCSCSTIPILVGLLNGGAPFGAAMSFLVASPLLNPIIIGLFLSLLGFKVTFMYAAITFVAAVLIGMLWEKMGLADQYKRVEASPACCCSCPSGEMEELPNSEEIPDSIENTDTTGKKFRRAGMAAWSLFRQVLPYLLLGAGIGAAIYGLVPDSLIMKVAGPGNLLAIPVAALVGVPMYIRAETIIPISAVLVQKGMSIGAVMALMIGGAGASIPEIIILGSIFRRKLVIAFAATILTTAILAGYLFDIIL